MNRVINFSHPLSEAAKEQIRHPYIENVRVQLDLDSPISTQITEIVESIKTPLDGTIPGLGIVLPALSEACAYVVAAIHARTGTFPTIIPLRRNDEGIFVVATEGPQPIELFRREERTRR